MTDFDALTQPAYALVPTSQPDSFRVALDGVEVARLYLDAAAQEWALTANAALNALPPRFTHWAETFPRWSDLCAYLGADLPRPATVAANTVVDVVNLMLAAAGLATTQELTAEIARRDAADRTGFGHAVAEHRRLRQAHALVAAGIRAGLVEINAGRSANGLAFLAEAYGTAMHHSAFARAEVLPADVPVLSRVRAERIAAGGGSL